VLEILNEGNVLGSFQIGFFRSEGEGVFRVGQTGVGSAKESRLYVVLEQKEKKVFIVGIGTKETQPADINAAREMAKTIRIGE
jgi:hypothetical protein